MRVCTTVHVIVCVCGWMRCDDEVSAASRQAGRGIWVVIGGGGCESPQLIIHVR